MRLIDKCARTTAGQEREIWETSGHPRYWIRTSEVGTDLRFIKKIVDLIGLSMSPFDHVTVLSFNKKTQALDRTQAPLPTSDGHPEVRTRDYGRQGLLTSTWPSTS